MKPLVEAVDSKAREANARITVASGSVTKTKLTEGIIKMKTVITLEIWFKRE